MLGFLARFQRLGELRGDPLFSSLLVLSLVGGGVAFGQRIVRQRTLERGELCAAQRDAACASKALEALRSEEPPPVRVAVLEVELRVMTNDVPRAAAELAVLRQRALDGVERGAVLLAEADVAVAQRRWDEAEAFLKSARALAPVAYVTPRESEITRARAAQGDFVDGLRTEIRAEFERLIATMDDDDMFRVRQSDLQRRIAFALPGEARGRLSSAMLALSNVRMTRDRFFLGPPPRAPVPPVDGASKGALTAYEAEKQHYERTLADYETRKRERDAATAKAKAAAVEQSRGFREEGLALLTGMDSSPGPMGVPVMPGVVGPSRPLRPPGMVVP